MVSGGKKCLTSDNIPRSVILYDLVLSGASKGKWLGLWINSLVENILKELKSQFSE